MDKRVEQQSLYDEIRKDIEGYEGLYMVSNMGNVKTLGTQQSQGKGCYKRKEKIMKLHGNPKYMRVTLRKDGKSIIKFVHRLVVEAFIPNPENKGTVNHKNTDTKDNRVENLEWMTHSENIIYGYKYGNMKPPMGGLGKKGLLSWNSKKLYQMDLSGNIIKLWDSSVDVMRELGYNDSCINKVCRETRRTAYGFKWVRV